ncbi:MAG: NAD-dependent epimerase/dehydratase family protein, partial [Phycisphaerae bacterium]
MAMPDPSIQNAAVTPARGNAARVVVAGSSGLVGTALCTLLRAHGHHVDRLVRRPARPEGGEIRWDPARGSMDAASLEGVDFVVNLAGEPIASGRWTQARKQAILESRTQGTRLLCETLARLDRRPQALVSASAVGYYGD